MSSDGSGRSRYRAWLGEIGRRVGRRLYISASQEQVIVEEFRKSYLGSVVESWWLGEQVTASPLDLWVYQEIMHETRAEVVVAVASRSASYLAAICLMYARGEVLSPETFAVAQAGTIGRKSVMVIIGAGCSDGHLAQQLTAYCTLVTTGSYLVVEYTQHDRARAVAAFLEMNPEFSVDRRREKFYFTQNPGGFLRRH